MVDHEFEIEGRFSVPLLARLSARYKRNWADRSTTYLEDVAADAGLDAEHLEARCESNALLTDLIVQGGTRAGAVEDRSYRRTLSALAAAAFADEAMVDELALLHSQILSLEPAHLRVLDALNRTLGEPQHDDPDEPGVQYKGRDVEDFRELYATGLLTMPAVQGALATLSSAGMVERHIVRVEAGGAFSINHGFEEPGRWSVTSWGLDALSFLKRHG